MGESLKISMQDDNLFDAKILHRLLLNKSESIEHAIFVRHFKKDTNLRLPNMLNKYVYLLKEGVVKIALMNEEGKEFIKYLIKPGNLFGEIPLLENVESSDEYAVALEDSAVCFIDTEKMKQWMIENSNLRAEVFKVVGSRIKKVENRLAAMFFEDAPTRVRKFLVEFINDFGEKTLAGYEVKNFLTNEDIAKLTITSRQTVSTVMNEMRKRKQIEYNAKTIKIPGSSALLSEQKKTG